MTYSEIWKLKEEHGFLIRQSEHKKGFLIWEESLYS